MAETKGRPRYILRVMVHAKLSVLIGSMVGVILAACNVSSDAGGDAAADAGPPIPFGCGATEDCLSAGLDADTCVYKYVENGCAYTGECQHVELPADLANCAKRTVCPCSGDTQIIACFHGYSPYPIQSFGACPVDAAK